MRAAVAEIDGSARSARPGRHVRAVLSVLARVQALEDPASAVYESCGERGFVLAPGGPGLDFPLSVTVSDIGAITITDRS